MLVELEDWKGSQRLSLLMRHSKYIDLLNYRNILIVSDFRVVLNWDIFLTVSEFLKKSRERQV